MEQKIVITDVDIPFKKLFMLILKINLIVLGCALPLGLISIAVMNGLSFAGTIGLLFVLVVVVFFILYFVDTKE